MSVSIGVNTIPIEDVIPNGKEDEHSEPQT